jgi:hypothetical protein
MRNALILSIYLSIFHLFGQESNINNAVFINFEQFKDDKPCEVEILNIKDKTDLLLTVENIDLNCKGFKKINKTIAIRYNQDLYYNMRYNVEFMTKNRFSKLVVKGKYCAFLVDESYPINIQGQAGFNTGGLVGALILGPNGKNKIYYLNIDKGHKTKVLTKTRLRKLLEIDEELLNSFDNEIKENWSAELFLNYLERLNKKYE